MALILTQRLPADEENPCRRGFLSGDALVREPG